MVPDSIKDNDANRRNGLIAAGLEFVTKASRLEGIIRIAFIGSITTDKPHPKDIDLLVTIDETVNLEKLARLGRQLKGRSQGLSSGADIFLLNTKGDYIGRTCNWTKCEPRIRMACTALNCGDVQYLYDDLQIVNLPANVTANPPLVVFPDIIIRGELPDDLLKRLRQTGQ